MRSTILKKIEAATPLAQLFNAYLKGLRSLEIIALPHLTMRETRQAFAAESRGEDSAFSVTEQAQCYFELTVASNTLNSLYSCIEGAANKLTEFFTLYGGDLGSYAAANRRHCLSEYGSDDPADWQWKYPTEPDPNEPEGWEIAPTSDHTRLKPYTLYEELAQLFPDAHRLGEFIGTSSPEDFTTLTAHLIQQTETSFRRIMADIGQQVPICRQNEAGELIPVSLGDQIEQELNEDIANNALAEAFNAVLSTGVALAEVFATMPRDELAGYQLLHHGLNELLGVSQRFK